MHKRSLSCTLSCTSPQRSRGCRKISSFCHICWRAALAGIGSEPGLSASRQSVAHILTCNVCKHAAWVLQIGDWFANFEMGRSRTMNMPRPESFQSLPDRNETWSVQQGSQQSVPLLNLEEAKQFHHQPIELPKLVKPDRPDSRFRVQ